MYKRAPGIVEIVEKIKDKTYYYIGLENRSRGYACRNKYIKKNIGANNYSYIDNKQTRTIITEGIIDYISLYQKHLNTVNYVILNSVNNINKVINDKILDKKDILIYLDNDNAGNKCLNKINEYYDIRDRRWEYSKYKDYNEYYKNEGYKEEEEKINKKYKKEAEKLLNEKEPKLKLKQKEKNYSPTM